jgi:hypothetical protein
MLAGQDEAAVAAVDEEPAAAPQPRYGLCEAEDGEWAVMRLFKTPEQLARRLGELEGQDTVALPFYGVPLPFTKGPRRFLALPDGGYVTVPLYPGEPVKRVEASEVSVPVEPHGYVGPREMAQPAPMVRVGTNLSRDEDEDDEE